jgi:ABC-2 type transport system ATP-binding protein
MTANINQPAIAVRGLRKSYGEKVVLDGVDLSVAKGTIFSLLGPNGAGKTTMVQILSTLIRADSGDIRVAGHDPVREPDAVRAAIGMTGQFSAVDKLLTGEENLLLMADLHHLGRREGRRRAAELLARFDLVEAGGKLASTYSGGMQRRLDLAMTLVGAPQVIFLDEPTTGLDPRSRRGLWQIIRELVAEGTPAELKRRIPGGHVNLRFADAAELDLAALTLGAVGRDDEALVLQVPHDGGVHALRGLLARLDDASIEVEELTVHTPDLDDVFLTLTDKTMEAVR